MDTDASARTEQVRSGQKLAIWAILLNLISIPFLLVPDGAMIRAPMVLIALVLAVLGIVRVARALDINLILVVLMALGMLVPFVNLIILLVINSRATRYLREQGYQVGMLGANKRS